jgi:hypothetical protein
MPEFTWSIYDDTPASQANSPPIWQHPGSTSPHVYSPQQESSQYVLLPPINPSDRNSTRSRSTTPAWPASTPAAINLGYTPLPSPSIPSSPVHQQPQIFHVLPSQLPAEAYWGSFVSTEPGVRSPMLVRLCLAMYDFAKNTSANRVPKQQLTSAKPFLLPEMVIAIFDLSLDMDLLPFNESDSQSLTPQKIDVGE